jgi:hypothetical protein
MIVIRNQMGIYVMLAQQFRERLIEGFERAPAAMQKIQPSCVHVAPCWHARQAAHEVIVECNGPFCEALEIGRVY